MSEKVKLIQPLHLQLREFLNTHGYSNKDIAIKFGYTEANISDYLQGKASENSKLHIIVELFLELEKLKESNFSTDDKDLLEGELELCKLKCAKHEGENLLAKSIIRDLHDKLSLNSAELRETIKDVIAEEGYTLLHAVNGKDGESK